MQPSEPLRVGFVVKRYPRYSETFIVREILAHEAAGLEIVIFAMRPPNDTHFQDLIARVRAPVRYLHFPAEGLISPNATNLPLSATHFWDALRTASQAFPHLWSELAEIGDAEARDVYQALILAGELAAKRIAHLHAPFAHDMATVARLASRLTGVPFSFTARAKDIFLDTVQPEDLRRKLRDATGAVTISAFHLEHLRKSYPEYAHKIQHIYNGLNLEEFQYRSPADRPLTILGVGRLIEKKGFRDLIDACAILAKRGRNFGCRIIGEGPLWADLAGQIDSLGLRETVKMLGPLPQNEVMQAMLNAGVLAMPCIVAPDGDRDGLPNVIQEALAVGTPVISTDVTGIPEVVRDGETGLQVPQHDPPALAAAIERLLLDPALRVRLATGARKMMERDFDIHRNTERRRAIFRNGKV
jgi:glycosyltransferase involved in cell wall biosynthesis